MSRKKKKPTPCAANPNSSRSLRRRLIELRQEYGGHVNAVWSLTPEDPEWSDHQQAMARLRATMHAMHVELGERALEKRS